jgi:anti-sigma B factor antagonist
MDFQTKEIRDILIIEILEKRATMKVADPLREYLLRIIDKGQRKIVLDLTNVEFMDSTFLGALMAGMKRLIALNGEIRLCGKNSHISELLNITRLNRIFSLYSSVKEAIISF